KNPTTAKKRFRVISMCDNLSLLTAWANDVSFDTVFAEQLKGLARPGDVLLVITGSGNSPNILRALETAQEVGMKTLGWLGFDGGKALSLCDRSILVRTHDYGLVESAHAVLTHLITSWLMGCRGGEP
ncbi:MAG: SIS domain-containing protein, partial [Deltaproteobacteria bacterium]|nr:SIS domain-containing protein [Deltaproteobacteria bacterium]